LKISVKLSPSGAALRVCSECNAIHGTKVSSRWSRLSVSFIIHDTEQDNTRVPSIEQT
jgi:hypothetical protein